MRDMLSDAINAINEFEVIDVAEDAYEAREKIKQHEPDLVTIDINMPKMNGVSFLRNLMRLHPMPAIIVSGDVSQSKTVFEDGAIGFVRKKDLSESQETFCLRLRDKLLSYTFLLERYTRKKPKPLIMAKNTMSIEMRLDPNVILMSKPAPLPGNPVIAIGASTGGVEALLQIFRQLEPPLPPIVIAQHIPYGFSQSFSERLNAVSPIAVHEAQDNQILKSSHAYLAPGDKHLLVIKEGQQYLARTSDGPKVSRHKPSVDVLFRSVNNSAGSAALGIIMTGMGDDGVIGLKEMCDNGAMTIAQDEKSCAVFGMPKKAIESKATRQIHNIEGIVAQIQEFAKNSL